MRFTKMHGIGNDYIYVDGFEEIVNEPEKIATAVSDRHKGVGADGLVLVLPPDNGTDAHVRMRIFNADGSEAEMCGNGIRCLCKFAHDRELSTANPMRVQTGRGILSLDYTLDQAGKVNQVTVDMGEPILDPLHIPVRIPNLPHIINHSIKTLIDWPDVLGPDWIKDAGLDQHMTCVSTGNPHAVFYCDDLEPILLPFVGPVIDNHPVFPNRVNVHFVQVHTTREVTMATWERGSGVTLACGTGATAVCVAGVLTDRTDRQLLAHLPGGDLRLDWQESDNHVYMTGPAAEIFSGDWPEQSA